MFSRDVALPNARMMFRGSILPGPVVPLIFGLIKHVFSSITPTKTSYPARGPRKPSLRRRARFDWEAP